jgi:glycosyltransferase involved in cell wall biosynthesis
MKVIANGINLRNFRHDPQLRNAARLAWNIPIERRIVVSVGRLTKAKNHDLLLTAFAALRSDYANVELIVVGDGPRRTAIEALADDLGIRDVVRFVGMQSDIPKWMNMADLLVLSSTWEGMGLVLIEAMACGTPVLTTRVGGASALVSGIWPTVAPSDPRALSATMGAILTAEPDWLATRIDLGIDRSMQFDIEGVSAQWLTAYSEAADKSR